MGKIRLGIDYVSNEFQQFDKVEITPGLATEFLKRNVNNRPLNKKHVDELADQMSKGLWIFNGDSIKFNTKGELVNGQHTCSAVVKSGKTITMNVQFGLPVDSFKVMDTSIRTRGAADVLDIEGAKNYTTLASIIKRQLRLNNGNTISDSLNGSSRHKGESAQEILGIYKSKSDKYNEIVETTNTIYNNKKCNRVLSKSVVGGYIAFLEINLGWTKEVVEKFFKNILDVVDSGDIFNPNTQLLKTKLIRSKTSGVKQDKLSSKVQNAYIIKTWNAYVTPGKIIKTLNYNEKTEKNLSFKSAREKK